MYIFYRACGTFLPNSLYLHRLFQKAYVFAPCNCRTDKDVREIEQRRVCPANSTLNSVHGSILLDERAMLVAENKLSLKLNN